MLMVKTTFYIFAEDIAYVGGLVGQNHYSNTNDEADFSRLSSPKQKRS